MQSLYLNKEDYQKKKSAETLLMQNAPAHTPKVQVGKTSNNSITEKSEIVNSNNKKSQFNLKPNPQISLSKGEIRKLVANYTRPKVYSRNETEISINNLIEELGELFTTEKISFKGKSKEEAIQMLWQGLNTVQGKDRQAFAEKVAEYIIKNSIVESTYKDADYDYYADVYNVLHSYVQKFNLDHIKTEIETKYGKEKSKSIIARWQSKDGKGMSVDGYAEEINELGYRIDYAIYKFYIFTNVLKITKDL